MNLLNPQVDLYLVDGCGRCNYYATPQCKVRKWTDELVILRQIVLEFGLNEEIKWGVPVYTFQNKNIVNISAFKAYCCISFFKGALLKDTEKILKSHGESSQSVRTINFTNKEKLIEITHVIKDYIIEAIDIEKRGEKVIFNKNLEPIPDELLQKFTEMPLLKTAFYSLTQGRQRGYVIFISQAKQSSTRISRIEKCIPLILNGKGLQDS